MNVEKFRANIEKASFFNDEPIFVAEYTFDRVVNLIDAGAVDALRDLLTDEIIRDFISEALSNHFEKNKKDGFTGGKFIGMSPSEYHNYRLCNMDDVVSSELRRYGVAIIEGTHDDNEKSIIVKEDFGEKKEIIESRLRVVDVIIEDDTYENNVFTIKGRVIYTY